MGRLGTGMSDRQEGVVQDASAEGRSCQDGRQEARRIQRKRTETKCPFSTSDQSLTGFAALPTSTFFFLFLFLAALWRVKSKECCWLKGDDVLDAHSMV